MLLIVALFHSVCEAGNVESSLPTLIENAQSLSLWEDPQWRSLLHITTSSGNRSKVTSDDFFLTPDEPLDIRAELFSALHSLETHPIDNEHAVCRFPDRFLWLQQRLGVNLALPFHQCSNYQEKQMVGWFE